MFIDEIYEILKKLVSINMLHLLMKDGILGNKDRSLIIMMHWA